MDFLFLVLRKCLVGVISLVFAFAVTYIPQQHNRVHYVEAAFPVIDAANLTPNIGTAVSTAFQQLKDSSLDAIAFMLAKTMISQMLQSMVVWINNGFEGSPAFIQDLDKFLLGVADEAAGEYIKSLGELGSFICEPFRLDISIALKLQYMRAKNNNREDRCNVSDIVDNVEKFFDQETRGSNFWQQWVEVTTHPRDYTPYGQFMEAEANLNAKLVNAKGRELELVKMGDGFLSGKVCKTIFGANGTEKECVISKPGRVIADQLNKSLGAGQDQLVAADEINEVISALLGQIAVQAVTGAAGLLGLSPNSSGYAQTDSNGNTYVDNLIEDSKMDGTFIEQGINDLETKLAVQEDYNELATQYIPLLFAVKNNPGTPDELRSDAEISYEDATQVLGASDEHMRVLRPLVTEFRELENEFTTADESRKDEIRVRQSKIITTGGTYRAYTEDRYIISSREWKRITGQ